MGEHNYYFVELGTPENKPKLSGIGLALKFGCKRGVTQTVELPNGIFWSEKIWRSDKR